jgi:hypothetical protein
MPNPLISRRAIVVALAAPVAALVVATVGFGVAEGDVTGTASGTIYRDVNDNGVRDRGEPGVPGIVVQTGSTATITNDRGAWTLPITERQRIDVLTGWYRSQCDTLTCPVGPGRDQDFGVTYQNISVVAIASKNPRLDLGLVPDWPGGYPMPNRRRVPANPVDVAARVSFVKPTGDAGASNCYRTDDIRHRACAVGDRPSFLLQVYNEGTRPLTSLAGHLQLPRGTTLVSAEPSTTPRNHPAMGTLAVGSTDPWTRRVPFAITGTLPPAAAAMYRVTLRIDANAPITTTLQTQGSYPNPIGVRITSVVDDAEGAPCAAADLTCRWGVTDRQAAPDDSDTVGFAIVPVPGSSVRDDASVTTTTSSTAAPTTTVVATTVPPTTTAATTTTAVTTTTAAPTTTTVPPTTVPPLEPASCTVSSLLVPSCGVWLGASTPSADGTYDYVRGLAEYEAVAQDVPDILHFYKTGAKQFPNAREIEMAERPGQQRSILFYNWKPSKTLTWAQIAAGGADADIATVAAGLQRYPHTMFLTIFHEPEDNVVPTAGSGMTPQDYTAMYRHVVDRLRGHGVDNVVYVWNVMGYHGWRHYLDDLFPGPDYVDWIAYDPYAKNDVHADLLQLVDSSRPAIGWPGFYSWAAAKAPGTPMMLAEWGVDTLTNSDPAGVLRATDPAELAARYPLLRALVYWNDIDQVNARIDQSTPLGTALGAAYRDFADHPLFAATPTAAAP